jgi:hypothetical protein
MNAHAQTIAPVHANSISAPSVPLGAVKRVAKAVWHQLELIGHSRAQKVMLRLAEQYDDTRPEIAAQLRDAARYNPYR